MSRYIFLAVIVTLLISFFAWGVNQNEKAATAQAEKECGDEKIKTIIKEVEVIKYVTKEKADIYSKPNAGRNQLLNLMHESKL